MQTRGNYEFGLSLALESMQLICFSCDQFKCNSMEFCAHSPQTLQQQILQATRIHSKQRLRFGRSVGAPLALPVAPSCDRIEMYEAEDRVRRCVPPIDLEAPCAVVSANAALGCVA